MTDRRVNYSEPGNWNVQTTVQVKENGGQTASTETIMMSTLCVIRDELKVISRKLNALECPNFVAIPHTLKRISRNTAKKRKPKAAKPKLRVVR